MKKDEVPLVEGEFRRVQEQAVKTAKAFANAEGVVDLGMVEVYLAYMITTHAKLCKISPASVVKLLKRVAEANGETWDTELQ